MISLEIFLTFKLEFKLFGKYPVVEGKE